eukprot:4221230-Alexandrium_andersonii.AAC.1
MLALAVREPNLHVHTNRLDRGQHDRPPQNNIRGSLNECPDQPLISKEALDADSAFLWPPAKGPPLQWRPCLVLDPETARGTTYTCSTVPKL